MYLCDKNLLSLDNETFKKKIYDHTISISEPYDLDEATFISSMAKVNIKKSISQKRPQAN